MNRGKIKLLFFFITTLFIFQGVRAQQTKESLEAEKKAALERVKEAQQILDDTQVKKKNSLGQLAALNNQIDAGKSLIGTINNEITLINSQMDELNDVIHSLQSDLDKLKAEYSVMALNAYKSEFGLRDLTFLFSSATFSQLVMRMKYMKQYSEERKKQLELINETKQSLITQEKALEEKRLEKNKLLTQQINQQNNLIELKNKQGQLIADLSKKESELKAELEKHKKDIAQLDKKIADLVAEEIRKSSKGKSNERIAMTPNLANLSKSFEENQNKLPWPVASGFISSHFGTHPHPIYKKLSVPNYGIDIQTNSNEVVRAVFDGVVKAIAFVPGDMKYFVLIQHGEYFTVYAKLKDVTVKQGQVVKTNDPIGIVKTNNDDVSEVQFQVWKDNKKLNPENWLAKK